MIVAAAFVHVVEDIGRAIEAVGVTVTAMAVVLAIGRFALAIVVTRADAELTYLRARRDVGRGMLLGLEVLVAGDIIRTVGVNPTPTSVALLGAVVLIRTFLTVAIKAEVEDGPTGMDRLARAAASTIVPQTGDSTTPARRLPTRNQTPST